MSGVRAIDHAVKAVYARNASPFITALSLGSLGLLTGNLVRSVAGVEDFESALACQTGPSLPS